ncbi:MAG: hypothetical protein GY754_32000 [bacterium]|nr:hypothetical protein [bacterium]
MNLVYTTFNISMTNFEILQSSAKKMKIARSRLVELLVRRVMEEKPFELTMFSTVKYQVREEDESWYCCHVVFDSATYEICGDLRKIFKLSVSAIISYAINNCLDEVLLLKKPKIHADNYHHAYLFSKGEPDGISAFVVFWGVPGQETLGRYLL